jgi:hypothetical protein
MAVDFRPKGLEDSGSQLEFSYARRKSVETRKTLLNGAKNTGLKPMLHYAVARHTGHTAIVPGISL